LCAAGHEVVGIDNLNDYYDVRLKQWRLEQLKKLPGFTFHEVDIENRSALRTVFEKGRDGSPQPSAPAAPPPNQEPSTKHQAPATADSPSSKLLNASFDAVINLAARAGVRASIETPEVYFTTNVMGSLHLLELIREFEVPKYVLASTSSLYAGHPLPFSEDQPVNRPISPYAASKKGAEAMAFTWHHLYGIDTTIVRYFTVYGPAGRPDMSPLRFIRWIDEGTPITLYGDGSQTRDFTFIDDIARGTIAALKLVGFEVINLGGGNNPISIRSMIDAFASQLGKEPVIDQHPFHEADMKDTQAVIDKARSLLDWSPKTPPAEGFRQTVDWYLANRELVQSLEL
jgi:nucleoside-diphosphate-sugar epimerase